MAVFASQEDVLARAGRFAGLFNVPGRRPNLEDLDEMLVTVSAAISTEIEAHGYDPATLTADLLEGLRDVAAWATLVRSLPQASPGDNAIDDLIAQGDAILKASGFASLGTGLNVLATIGAIEALEAGRGGGGPGTSAGSFWDSLPEEWMTGRLFRRGDVTLLNGQVPDDLLEGMDAAPTFRRGQSL